jgi:chaperonin GroES
MMKPLSDRVIIKPAEGKDKSKGGILLPETAKEKSQEGEIVAVGEGRKDETGKVMAMSVKKGDKVLYGKYSGTEIMIDGVEHMIVREDDILAIL